MGIWVKEAEGFWFGKSRFHLCLRSSSSSLSLPFSSFSLVLCLSSFSFFFVVAPFKELES